MIEIGREIERWKEREGKKERKRGIYLGYLAL